MKNLLIALAGSTALLSACNNADDRADFAENRVEGAAGQSAAATADTERALGLTEAQLLDADLIGPNDVDLGDVEGVVRGANGQVEQLLIEIEDSEPDRYVHVPITGLTPVRRGDDTDLSTTMTADELAALPDAPRR